MPPVPPQMFPRISTISPIGGERSNAADAQAVRRQTTVTRAPRSRARLISATNSRRFVAKPRTPHLHCAARAALQDQGWQCNLSLGGSRGIFSFEKENIPLSRIPCTVQGKNPSPLKGYHLLPVNKKSAPRFSKTARNIRFANPSPHA